MQENIHSESILCIMYEYMFIVTMSMSSLIRIFSETTTEFIIFNDTQQTMAIQYKP